MLTSLTPEQQHCTIQFSTLVAPKKKKKTAKLLKFWGKELGEDNTCIAEVQSWFDKSCLALRSWIYSQNSKGGTGHQPD